MAERGPGSRSGWTLRAPYLLVAIPTGFLLIFFVVPTMMLLSASILKSNGMMPVGGLSTGNFRMLLSESIYVGAIIRTFEIGLAVGVLLLALLRAPHERDRRAEEARRRQRGVADEDRA